jgi:hypothetical protein
MMMRLKNKILMEKLMEKMENVRLIMIEIY